LHNCDCADFCCQYQPGRFSSCPRAALPTPLQKCSFGSAPHTHTHTHISDTQIHTFTSCGNKLPQRELPVYTHTVYTHTVYTHTVYTQSMALFNPAVQLTHLLSSSYTPSLIPTLSHTFSHPQLPHQSLSLILIHAPRVTHSLPLLLLILAIHTTLISCATFKGAYHLFRLK
jgi:hypothetical protein